MALEMYSRLRTSQTLQDHKSGFTTEDNRNLKNSIVTKYYDNNGTAWIGTNLYEGEKLEPWYQHFGCPERESVTYRYLNKKRPITTAKF